MTRRQHLASLVVAQPHGQLCPHCHQNPGDWYFEWLEPADYQLLFKAEATTDCVLCKQPVTYQRMTVSLPPPGSLLPLKKRSKVRAERYAKNEGLSLEELLSTVAMPYRGYFD